MRAGSVRLSRDAHSNLAGRLLRAALPVVFGLAISCSAGAQQNPHFISAESYMGIGLNDPLAIAVDADSNVYIADARNNRVLKETFSASGYVQSVLPTSTLNYPAGVAVDPSGNVYIADSNNGRILKETLSAGSYTESVVDHSLIYPSRIAVDSDGNVYLSDFNDQIVIKETLSDGNYTQSTILTTADGLENPIGIAVDGSGAIYISGNSSDLNNPYVIMKFTRSGNGYTSISMGAGLSFPWGIAVDSGGNVYIADRMNYRVVKETLSYGEYTQSDVVTASYLYLPIAVAVDPGGNIYIAEDLQNSVRKESPSGAGFGAVAVGATSDQIGLSFNLGNSAPLGSKAVVTGGAVGSDFFEVSGGSCVAGQGDADSVCTLWVKFHPTLAGARYGAVVLEDASGSPIATGYLQGVGTGPQINFSPGTQSWIGNGMNKPAGVAVDENHNLYVADWKNNRVVKIGVDNNSQTTVSDSTLNEPQGVAVDGAGNIYIADYWNSRVIKEALSPSGYWESVVDSNFNGAMAVAVDGSGNVYTCDWNNQRAVKDSPSPSGFGYIQSTILDNAGGLNSCIGIAVDAGGNVYILDQGKNSVFKETPSGGSYILSTIVNHTVSTPTSIAVDGNGNLYIADYLNDRVVKETPSGGAYTQTTVVDSSSGLKPYAVTADPLGNVYVTYLSKTSVLFIDNFDPPGLTFPLTNVGAVSAPQTVTVENIGNAPMTFPRPASGANPSVSTNFNWNPSLDHACPEVLALTSVESWTLPAGGYCLLANITFAPTTTGSLSGYVTLTDDSLNAPAPQYAKQSLELSGKATDTLATPTVLVTPSQSSILTSRVLTVDVAIGGAAGQPVPTGTVTLSTGVYSAQQALSAGAATFTIPAGTLLGGTNTLKATYAGDASYIAASGTAAVKGMLAQFDAPPTLVITRGTGRSTTITVWAGSTYSGKMRLVCGLVSAPAGAQSIPPCLFSPDTVNISAAGSATSALILSATAGSSAAHVSQLAKTPWGLGGAGAFLAAVFLFGIPARRRRWLSMLALLWVVVAASAIGCGSKFVSTPVNGPIVPATTAGTYVFSLTATDTANSLISTSVNITVEVE